MNNENKSISYVINEPTPKCLPIYNFVEFELSDVNLCENNLPRVFIRLFMRLHFKLNKNG